MVLLWTVPVAVAVGALVALLSQARKLEDLSVGLARDVVRLREIRPPLAGLRRQLDRSGPLMDEVWSHWDEDRHPPDGAGDRRALPDPHD